MLIIIAVSVILLLPIISYLLQPLSTLILFIMYLGILTLHGSFSNLEKADRLMSILVIIGVVNIPIIFQVFPLQEVADLGRPLGIPLIVDNTAAPLICRPFDP